LFRFLYYVLKFRHAKELRNTALQEFRGETSSGLCFLIEKTYRK